MAAAARAPSLPSQDAKPVIVEVRAPSSWHLPGTFLVRLFPPQQPASFLARPPPPPSSLPPLPQVIGCASLIKTDQSMYYLAHPETGKKVTQQNVR